LGQLIAARVITGLGVGAFTATVPMWVTGCSNAHNRGKMVMLEGMFAIGGVAFAVWLDFGFFFLENNSANWRFPIAFQAVFAIVVALFISMLPVGVNMLAQMTGVNIITFYSNEVFTQILGYSGVTSRVVSGCLQIWQFCMATLAVFLIDRLGRRKLLMIGTAGMTIAQAGQAALTKYSHASKSVAGATLLFSFLALGFFPIGMFLIPFMYAA
ncbi:hypothetical protein KCU65_g9796, partial [Aureobasidium melanogenum]